VGRCNPAIAELVCLSAPLRGGHLYLSLCLFGSRGDSIPRNTLEAYDAIAKALYETHGKKPFRVSEVTDLLMREMNVLLERTAATHVERLVGLGYLVRVNATTFRLARWVVESAPRPRKFVDATWPLTNAKKLRRRH